MGVTAAHAQGSDPEIAFSNQARHWEAQGRDDLARDSWLRLLRVSPDNPSALAGLALAEARTGRQSAAGVYLERLRKVAPDHPEIPRAEAAIRAASFDQKQLDAPRKLAQEGRFADAVAAYQRAFDGKVPKWGLSAVEGAVQGSSTLTVVSVNEGLGGRVVLEDKQQRATYIVRNPAKRGHRDAKEVDHLLDGLRLTCGATPHTSGIPQD